MRASNIFNARINLLKRNLQSSSLTDFIEPRVNVNVCMCVYVRPCCVCIRICKMLKSITIKNVFGNFVGWKVLTFQNSHQKRIRCRFICYILRSVNTSSLVLDTFGDFFFVTLFCRHRWLSVECSVHCMRSFSWIHENAPSKCSVSMCSCRWTHDKALILLFEYWIFGAGATLSKPLWRVCECERMRMKLWNLWTHKSHSITYRKWIHLNFLNLACFSSTFALLCFVLFYLLPPLRMYRYLSLQTASIIFRERTR